MQTSALFGEKIRIFRNLWCVRMDKGGEGKPSGAKLSKKLEGQNLIT